MIRIAFVKNHAHGTCPHPPQLTYRWLHALLTFRLLLVYNWGEGSWPKDQMSINIKEWGHQMVDCARGTKTCAKSSMCDRHAMRNFSCQQNRASYNDMLGVPTQRLELAVRAFAAHLTRSRVCGHIYLFACIARYLSDPVEQAVRRPN